MPGNVARWDIIGAREERRPAPGPGLRGLVTDLGPHLLLVVVAAAVAAMGAPWPVATPLAVVANIGTVERCVRSRGRGLLDAVAVGVGGWLVAAILVGLVLGVLPGGLTRRSWAVALAVVAVVALLLCHGGDGRPSRSLVGRLASLRPRPLNLVMYAVAGVLVLSALVGSVVSARGVQRPDLQLSIRQPGTSTTSSASVVVSSPTARGPLQLLVDQGRGARPLGAPFVVEAGRPQVVSVPVPDGARVTVSLVAVGEAVPLRRVSIDRSHLNPLRTE